MVGFIVLSIFYMVIFLIGFPSDEKAIAIGGGLMAAAVSVGATKLFGLNK